MNPDLVLNLCANPRGTPRQVQVDSTLILCRYVEDQISTNFRAIFAYFFDVISMAEKSTSSPCTFLDVISMSEKSMLFSHIYIGVISLVEKSRLFPRTFFNVICLVEICSCFFLLFPAFLVSCKLMKTLEDVFPVFATLNS